MPDISPAKIGLFEITGELLFQVCNTEPHPRTPQLGEGEAFIEGSGRAVVNKVSMAFHWLSLVRNEVFLPLVGLCYVSGHESSHF